MPRFVTALSCWTVLSSAAAASPAQRIIVANASASSTTASHAPLTLKPSATIPKPKSTACCSTSRPAGTTSLPASIVPGPMPAARRRGQVRQPCSRKIAKPTIATEKKPNRQAIPGAVCIEPGVSS